MASNLFTGQDELFWSQSGGINSLIFPRALDAPSSTMLLCLLSRKDYSHRPFLFLRTRLKVLPPNSLLDETRKLALPSDTYCSFLNLEKSTQVGAHSHLGPDISHTIAVKDIDEVHKIGCGSRSCHTPPIWPWGRSPATKRAWQQHLL